MTACWRARRAWVFSGESGSINVGVTAVATNLAAEIASKAATLPVDEQRKALDLIESLAARAATAKPHVPRAKRKLKGATAQERSISSEAIREAQHEV